MHQRLMQETTALYRKKIEKLKLDVANADLARAPHRDNTNSRKGIQLHGAIDAVWCLHRNLFFIFNFISQYAYATNPQIWFQNAVSLAW